MLLLIIYVFLKPLMLINFINIGSLKWVLFQHPIKQFSQYLILGMINGFIIKFFESFLPKLLFVVVVNVKVG